MKKTLLLLLLLYLSLFSAHSQDKEILSFSISENIGLLNGNISEYVYEFYSCKNTDSLLSRLDWDLKNIFFYEHKIHFDIVKYIYLGLDVLAAFSKESGNMQDYDWLNSFSISWYYDDPTELTNYSIHTNYLNTYNNLSCSLGLNFYFIPQTVLTAFLQFEYSYVGFDGIDGSSFYKERNWEEYQFSGKVISYNQKYKLPFIGLSFRNQTFKAFLINSSLAICPFCGIIDAYDYHWINSYTGGTLFWDNIINVFSLKLEAEARYKFNENHSLGLEVKFNYIPKALGYDYSKSLDSEGNTSSSNWSQNSTYGGSSSFIWSLSLGYTFSL